MSANTATQHTARVVEALEGALTNAGHEVDVPPRPTVADLERLCGLLGVKVSELVARVEAVGCPAWCLGTHRPHDPAHHQGQLHAGDGITLDFCQGLGEDVTILLPDDVEEGLTPARARPPRLGPAHRRENDRRRGAS